MKICKKCGIEKELTEFYRDNTTKDKLHSQCKKCAIKYSKERIKGKNRKELLEKQRQYSRKYIKNNPNMRHRYKKYCDVYKKYNDKYSECGNKNNLHIHHIDRRGSNYEKIGFDPNDDRSNLIVLCRTCHGKIHGKQSHKSSIIRLLSIYMINKYSYK